MGCGIDDFSEPQRGIHSNYGRVLWKNTTTGNNILLNKIVKQK